MADREFRVVVAGAGVSGLFMAETLKCAGIDFTVYEKAGDVGGTWRDNTFPGLFVDVLSRQYEFPFQPNYDWSRKYAPATEIWAYIKKVAGDRGLAKYIYFNEEIVAARFTEGGWHLETANGNSDVADVFICATGFLHQPLFPDIPGRESFAGPSFHSARWDHSVPYEGNRWGVIGSGASGVQITEALAWAGCDVTQFPPRPMGPYPREPALDLARALEAAPAGRLSTRTAPVVADDQRGRRLAPLPRATARRDGTRVPVLSRLHRRPRAEEEAYP